MTNSNEFHTIDTDTLTAAAESEPRNAAPESNGAGGKEGGETRHLPSEATRAKIRKMSRTKCEELLSVSKQSLKEIAEMEKDSKQSLKEIAKNLCSLNVLKPFTEEVVKLLEKRLAEIESEGEAD